MELKLVISFDVTPRVPKCNFSLLALRLVKKNIEYRESSMYSATTLVTLDHSKPSKSLINSSKRLQRVKKLVTFSTHRRVKINKVLETSNK